MSKEPRTPNQSEVSSDKLNSTTTLPLDSSSTSTSINLFYLIPPELRLNIYDFVNEDQGQLHHDYQTPALILAFKGMKDRRLYLEALTEYRKTNAHVTVQTEEAFLNKPKYEIERMRNLHITWGERA
jgi:hypothetical protein